MQIFNANITTAQTLTVGSVYQFGRNGVFFRPRALTLQGSFASAGNGTSVDLWVQTSFDGGAAWWDIAQFHFTGTSAAKAFNLNAQTVVSSQAIQQDGQLGNNLAVDGLIGNLLRTKWQSSGIYNAGTVLRIDAACDLKITQYTQ